jgi:uncharacterized SAM-binding protein YcdF (DUF218 family)
VESIHIFHLASLLPYTRKNIFPKNSKAYIPINLYEFPHELRNTCMIVDFIKLASALLYPLGLTFMCFSLSIALRVARKEKASYLALVLACVIVIGFSSPLVSTILSGSLEAQFPAVDVEDIPKHEAVVVLGGGIRIPTPPALRPQLGDASDRYLYAAELYLADRAEKIIISGGNLYKQEGLKGEAFYAKEFLKRMGVKHTDIYIEENSRTTEQNRNNVVNLMNELGFKKIILVTSALHMPRSLELFKSSTFEIYPAVADQQVRQSNAPWWTSLMPNADALRLSTKALHEYYGYWFYRLKAWLSEQWRV